ncbi:tetratricopeptide repeat protein, partial [Singulisphaera rosea]
GKTWTNPNLQVGVGLGAVVRKCLSPNVSGRYQDAGALADDLRRILNDLPPRLDADPSEPRRLRTWLGSRFDAPSKRSARGSILLTLGLTLGLIVLCAYQREVELETALEQGRSLHDRRQFSEAVRVLDLALARTPTFLPFLRSARALSTQRLQSHRARRAEALHEFANLLRFRYGVDPPSPDEARELEAPIRAFRRERDGLLDDGRGSLDSETKQRIQSDYLEMALVRSGFLDHQTPEDSPGSDSKGQSPRSAPGSHRIHYESGRIHLRNGRFAQASEEFERAQDLQPQEFWSSFYQGLCQYRLKQYGEAVATFRTCIAIRPNAVCYYNRGLALEALGKIESAKRDYGRALSLDPGLASAALNRGILAYHEGRNHEAIEDFQRGLRSSSNPVLIGRLHYNLALVHLARGDRQSALRSQAKALEYGCPEARALHPSLR